MRTVKEYKALMEKVNEYWMKESADNTNCGWERSTYFVGATAAYEVLKKKEYLDYIINWANLNNWSFYYVPNNPKRSLYDYTVHADSQLCAETYLKFLDEYGTDEHILESMDVIFNDTRKDYWWWIDAIHMALPFFFMMGVKYNDYRYMEKAHDLFVNTRTERKLYDEEEHLWYRDERFLPDKMRTQSGKKVFWARGNGWVFAGIARALTYLPKDDKYYNEYAQVLKDMAEKLRDTICEDGFWHTSIIAPDEFDMPETSGTTLFVYGFLAGVRLGILDESYLDVAMKGFEAITTVALEESGRIGWAQGVSDRPGPVEKKTTKDYVVGTYLLILKELIDRNEK